MDGWMDGRMDGWIAMDGWMDEAGIANIDRSIDGLGRHCKYIDRSIALQIY